MHRRRRNSLDTLSIRADGADAVLEHRRRRVAVGLHTVPRRAHDSTARLQPATPGALVPGERHRRHRRGQRPPGRDVRPGGREHVLPLHAEPGRRPRWATWRSATASRTATTNPQIKYAGRLAGDPLNTLGQTEQTLIDGTGTQVGNCGGSTCTRWGDYSGHGARPERLHVLVTRTSTTPSTGLNHHTRIGSFQFPGCTPVGNGTLSGTVSDGSNPIAGAIVTLGSRTTTTDGSGNYSFTVPAGTYASLDGEPRPASTRRRRASIAVPDGGSATRNFTLNAAAQKRLLHRQHADRLPARRAVEAAT